MKSGKVCDEKFSCLRLRSRINHNATLRLFLQKNCIKRFSKIIMTAIKLYFKAFGSGTNDLWQTMIHSGHHLSIIGRRKMTSPRIGFQMSARISLAPR